MKLLLAPYGPLIPVLGTAPVCVDTPARNATELLDWLHAQYPGLAPWRQRIACAVGDTLLSADATLAEGAEVALIPPVSGG